MRKVKGSLEIEDILMMLEVKVIELLKEGINIYTKSLYRQPYSLVHSKEAVGAG